MLLFALSMMELLHLLAVDFVSDLKMLSLLRISYAFVQVEYIQYIKTIPSQEGQQAETALFRRQIDEAERIFLNATPPLVYRAVKMNIRFYRWSRALDIALKFRTHVDTVLGYRQRFLEQFNKRETDQRFIQYASQVGG